MKRDKDEADLLGLQGVYAGYTYLGQFIDHDLTFDVTPLAYAHPDAKSIPNLRMPLLDLDQVYGGGPTVSPFLYRRSYQDRGKERFLIGKTDTGADDDLPRNPEGVALVGDPREDENLIIAQLHVAFLKFHNAVVEEFGKGPKSELQNVGPSGGSLFEKARRFVTWTYQFIVLNEFLPALVNEHVLNSSSAKKCRPGCFRIPIEFSTAAFRFGHSMVRDAYIYNETHGENFTQKADLAKLLCLTGTTGGIQNCLPGDWVIEWGNFFDLSYRIPTNNARAFNTKVAGGLHDLPQELLRLFSLTLDARQERTKFSDGCPLDATLPLPVRTLWRGARMGLPSGQDVANVLAVPVIDESNVAPPLNINEAEQLSILEKYDLLNDMPLWYYILKEAQQFPQRGQGTRLGPVGSHIVCDVILGCLSADPNSYLSINPNWTPDLPGESVYHMSNILLFVK